MNAVSCEAVNQSMILLYEKQGVGGASQRFLQSTFSKNDDVFRYLHFVHIIIECLNCK